MKLSIIIVSWNTRELLRQCLHSITESLQRPHATEIETLVVDNASTDGSVQMVQQHFPWVRLIQNEVNLGFASANNQALRVAQGRYSCLLNPDTEVRPGAVETLISFLEHHPQVGAVGPLLLNPDGTLQESCFPSLTLIREFWRMFHLDTLYPYSSYVMERWAHTRAREVDILKGACIIVRHDVLQTIGLLDESYFMYTEEVDLCHRIHRTGWRICWVPQAEVVHYGGQSTQQMAEKMFLCLYESKIRYFRKYNAWPVVWLYKFILLAATIVRLLVSPLAWLHEPLRRKRNFVLARYYRQLLVALLSM